MLIENLLVGVPDGVVPAELVFPIFPMFPIEGSMGSSELPFPFTKGAGPGCKLKAFARMASSGIFRGTPSLAYFSFPISSKNEGPKIFSFTDK